MSIEIRPATRADLDGVRRAAERAWHAAHAPIIGEDTTDEFLAEYYDAESFRSLLEDDDVLFSVADDGEVVGFATVSPAGDQESTPDDAPATFTLGRIYVRPDRWGEGVGRRLLDRVERAVDGRGGERIELGVMAENERAVEFYESAGYRRAGEFYDDRIDARGYDYEKEL